MGELVERLVFAAEHAARVDGPAWREVVEQVILVHLFSQSPYISPVCHIQL